MTATSRRSRSSTANDREEMEATLRQLGCCYDDERDEDRRHVLDILEKLLFRWSISLHPNNTSSSTTDNSPHDEIPPRVSVVTFGSYRLGVHRPQSDLDVLALSPPHCSRTEFFGSFVEEFLKKDQRITAIHSIPTAYTPVIKFLLNGIKIDLLFARLEDPTKLIAFQKNNTQQYTSTTTETDRGGLEEYPIDDSDLVGLDEAGVRSVNGARVSQRLLELVPDKANFRLVLRAVKAWADIHGVQSNVLGFLGGINWAILVAWVCAHHPETDPPKLLYLFFSTFARWKWPEPVTLGPICKDAPPGVEPMTAWDPDANPRDGLHLMPIITPSPAYPSMNSSYNVGIPQLRRLQDEMYRAAYLLEASHYDWKQIFRSSDFFQRHCNFLQIVMRADNPEDFLHWTRLCETKFRMLVANLETSEVNAWPFTRFYERQTKEETSEKKNNTNHVVQESYFFIALRFAPGVEKVDLRSLVTDFLQKINTLEGRKPGMDLSISRITWKELPAFVFDDNGTNNKSMGFALANTEEGLPGNPAKRSKIS